MNERTQEELRELANKYNGAVNEIKDLSDKLKVCILQLLLYCCDRTRNTLEKEAVTWAQGSRGVGVCQHHGEEVWQPAGMAAGAGSLELAGNGLRL